MIDDGGRDASAPSRVAGWRRLFAGRGMAAPVGGFVLGVVVVAAWLSGGERSGAVALSPAAPDTALAEERVRTAERLALLEGAAARLELAVAQAESMSRRALDKGASGPERFLIAMLHLQAAVASSRPWPREYEVAMGLAPPGAVPPALAEVLASHAARGLATEADLRERFAALAPAVLARASDGAGTLDRAAATFRSAFAVIGVATPPSPTDLDATLQRIQDHLRRGKLAAAVMDAEAIDPAVLPLVAGWLAQARARLAVEQAIQETVLRAIAVRGDSPS